MSVLDWAYRKRWRMWLLRIHSPSQHLIGDCWCQSGARR